MPLEKQKKKKQHSPRKVLLFNILFQIRKEMYKNLQ